MKSKANIGVIVDSPADNWGTQVIQHAVGSASSGDGTTINPLLVTISASDVSYDNSVSGASETNVQEAIDKLYSLVTESQFAELYNTADDSSSSGGINIANFTNNTENGAAFTANIAGSEIIVNGDCLAKITYTSSVESVSVHSGVQQMYVTVNTIPLPNSLTTFTIDLNETKVVTKSFMAYLSNGDSLQLIASTPTGSLKLNYTTFLVEFVA